MPHNDSKNDAQRATEEVSAPLDAGRTDLHKMISQLPDAQVETARRFLRFLIVDANRPLAAEYDEEPLSAEDIRDIHEAKAAISRGEFMTLEELERRLDDTNRKDG